LLLEFGKEENVKKAYNSNYFLCDLCLFPGTCIKYTIYLITFPYFAS